MDVFNDNIVNRYCSFGTVTDEDVKRPDLTGYTVVEE